MNIAHYIRLLGEGHPLHHDGTVLGVVDSEALAASNRNVVHRAHAEHLVDARHAEWVGVAAGASPPPPETHRERADRHLSEHADMQARHASEHREMRERHEEEHRQAIGMAGLAAAVTGI